MDSCVVSNVNVDFMVSLFEKKSISILAPLSMEMLRQMATIFGIDLIDGILGIFVTDGKNFDSVGMPVWWIGLKTVGERSDSSCKGDS